MRIRGQVSVYSPISSVPTFRLECRDMAERPTRFGCSNYTGTAGGGFYERGCQEKTLHLIRRVGKPSFGSAKSTMGAGAPSWQRRVAHPKLDVPYQSQIRVPHPSRTLRRVGVDHVRITLASNCPEPSTVGGWPTRRTLIVVMRRVGHPPFGPTVARLGQWLYLILASCRL